MIEFELALDLPASVRFHHEALEQIAQGVEEGVPSALLTTIPCSRQPCSSPSRNRALVACSSIQSGRSLSPW